VTNTTHKQMWMVKIRELFHHKIHTASKQNHNHRTSKNTRHKIYPKVRPHHKGVLLPVEEPQRVGSFSTIILHNPTTKVKGFFFSNVAHKSEDYKLLRVVHKFGDSQATSNCLEILGFQEHQNCTRGVCKKLKRLE
jgi:hypothetical protein